MLASLPPRRRAVMLLRYGWGLEPSQVCALIAGSPPRAYRKEVTRGVDELTAKMRAVESGDWCRGSRAAAEARWSPGLADEDADSARREPTSRTADARRFVAPPRAVTCTTSAAPSRRSVRSTGSTVISRSAIGCSSSATGPPRWWRGGARAAGEVERLGRGVRRACAGRASPAPGCSRSWPARSGGQARARLSSVAGSPSPPASRRGSDPLGSDRAATAAAGARAAAKDRSRQRAVLRAKPLVVAGRADPSTAPRPSLPRPGAAEAAPRADAAPTDATPETGVPTPAPTVAVDRAPGAAGVLGRAPPRSRPRQSGGGVSTGSDGGSPSPPRLSRRNRSSGREVGRASRRCSPLWVSRCRASASAGSRRVSAGQVPPAWHIEAQEVAQAGEATPATGRVNECRSTASRPDARDHSTPAVGEHGTTSSSCSRRRPGRTRPTSASTTTCAATTTSRPEIVTFPGFQLLPRAATGRRWTKPMLRPRAIRQLILRHGL